MASDTDKGTLSQFVYSEVRTAILSGQLRPGQRLKVSDLSAQYGVSLNVVREALSRLTGERLASMEPQVGFTVTDLSLEDFVDLIRVRVAIESTALRWSIANADVAWESELVAAHYRLAKTPMATEAEPLIPSGAWDRAHSEFHAHLISACGSPRMRDITRSLLDASEIHRLWSLSFGHPDRELNREHAELMEAALARDPDRAVAALTAHIELTRDAVIRNVTMGASSPDGPRLAAGASGPERWHPEGLGRHK